MASTGLNFANLTPDDGAVKDLKRLIFLAVTDPESLGKIFNFLPNLAALYIQLSIFCRLDSGYHIRTIRILWIQHALRTKDPATFSIQQIYHNRSCPNIHTDMTVSLLHRRNCKF